jgi:sugar O-acyltransferase (sialic acid O-acetyltransferase NeuD family)
MSTPGNANSLVLIGGGGHALVVAEAAFDSGWSPSGFYDDRADAPLASLVARLGAVREAADALRGSGTPAILCVGDLGARGGLLKSLAGVTWARVRHPSASVSRRAEIGAGVYLGARCVVNIRASVGDHAIINTGAIVEHECAIGRNAHIAPGVVLCGNVRVGEGTLVGAGARVIPGVKIGSGCVVGAGAVVVRDVPDGTVLIGVPARER